ncbi:FtsX-like permease family protein [Streptomyces sp. NPDC057694]|uniref:FtsX-like permease family protein n=1 Tax=Streptomyces sp. NPDC057694 TaxID=3346216 RepID=UPI0036B33446
MTGLALRTLRFHKGGFVASFLAMFLGALLVIACGGLLETGIHHAAPPQRLAAAPVVVTGDQRYHDTVEELVFPERIRPAADLADRLAAVPGVRKAVPDVSFPVTLNGEGSRATGHGWSSAALTPYRLTAGAPPAGADQVVVGAALADRAGLRVGARVGLLTNGTAERYEVSGIARGTDDGDALFLSDTEAARTSGHPRQADSIGLLTTPGTDPTTLARDVRRALAGSGTPLAVLTGDARGQAENPAVLADGGDLIPLAAAFGGLAVLVTVFVVAGTLGLSIRQRERELALLRAVGSTPGQLRRMVVAETLVLAAVATALACVPGPRAGRWLLGAFADAGVVPGSIAYRAGSVPLIVGIGTALLTAVCAALVAAHGAARTRPTEALAESGLQRRWFSIARTVTGALCLAGGTALALGTARSAGPDAGGVATPAALVWTAGFGLLGPVLARACTALLSRPLGAVSGLAGQLAAANARARTSRLASAVMPVMLATGLALTLAYLQTTESAGAERAFDESLRADLVVTSQAGGLTPDTLAAVRGTPGVAAATAQIPGTGYIETPRAERTGDGEEGASGPRPTELALRGVTVEGLDRTTSYRAATGSLGALRGHTVALPTADATSRGLRIGDPVPFRLGDGSPVTLKLVATLDGRRGYETALIPAALMLGHTDSGLIPQIMVTAARGTDRAALTAALTARSASGPGLTVTTREAVTAAYSEQDDTQAWMAYLVLASVVGYAVIALVNTQILATTERRREFGLQRLIGATRGQVLRMTAVEAVLTATVGIALGILVAACTLVPAGLSILDSALPSGSPLILGTVLAAALGLTVATTLLTAGAVLRTRPGDGTTV